MRRLFFLALLPLSACFVDAFAPTDDGGGGVGEGAGATGAGASGAGGTGPTGGGPTGGAPTETICDDGLDQDGDGDIDCDDADCDLSAACPGEWQVVTAEVVGHSDPSTAPCDSPTELLFSTPNDGDCSPCGCTNAAVCTSPTVQCWFTNNTCSGASSHTTTMATACSPGNLPGIPSGTNSVGSCRLTGPSVLASECVDSGSTPSTAAVAEDVYICTNFPLSAPRDQRCLLQAGEHACPAEFPKARTLFSGYDDTRNCSCDCTSTCAGGGYVANDNVNCMSSPHPPVSIQSADCTQTPNLWDFNDGTLQPLPGTATSSCAITETGEVTPIGIETLCCPN
jgi:hypothetical protein